MAELDSSNVFYQDSQFLLGFIVSTDLCTWQWSLTMTKKMYLKEDSQHQKLPNQVTLDIRYVQI